MTRGEKMGQITILQASDQKTEEHYTADAVVTSMTRMPRNYCGTPRRMICQHNADVKLVRAFQLLVTAHW